MATKLVSTAGPHAAGIFSDMTVDGPEIGTLVIIVDRGKNLPNRRTMGKQSAYCAARLGKEAKKTETDKRGGQTPRWDQELRYTVHDSPDYYNLKISVFSEDKRTDLVGEAWVNLSDVIVPGGGKNDMWQGLHCKGKYAGEIRIELTYYDSRPKPEKEIGEEEVDLRQSVGSGSRVKRRPLPTNPNGSAVTPDTLPEPAGPARAKHGPRDYRTPSRANSMPVEQSYQHQQLHSLYGNQPLPQHTASHGSSSHPPLEQLPPGQYYDEPQPYPEQAQYEEPYQEPDFLPQLPPTNRQRPVPQQRFASGQAPSVIHQPRPHSHIGLTHSYSAPMVPHAQIEPQAYDDGYQLRTDYPEPIPDVDYQHRQLRQRRNDVPPGWQEEYGDAYAQGPPGLEEESGPPPPPMHSISAPVVPRFAPSPTGRYGSAPPSSSSSRHNSVPNSSPLQSIERAYGSAHQTPVRGHHPRGRSVDEYATPPEQSPYGNTPPSLTSGQTPSPYARSPVARMAPGRHSIADPYVNTPPRPHPLSQEVPRARSPLPELPTQYNEPRYQQDYDPHGVPPLLKPRAISPRPAPPSQPGSRPRSSYSLQHPVRSFESADTSPLSTSQSNPRLAHVAGYAPATRKSVSPRPSPIESGSPGVPFSPDSFDVHNPSVRPSQLGTSPHTPYQVNSASGSNEPNGPIVGWHGQEIDPSDHLPVDSWAPEPEKKTPTKTYGIGRDRDFGPRTSQGVMTSGGRVSKDTVVNVRMKSAEHEPSPPAGRNRLVKKSGGPDRSPGGQGLSEHENYNSIPSPYAQQDYGRGFAGGSPGYGAPHIPPKVPLQHDYGPDALSREISSIDIGTSRTGRPTNGSVPPPTAYVPVRSHRDRQSYY